MTPIERDITVDGVRVHLWEGGRGFPILMLHGSGPGASTLGNWRPVLEPLSRRYHVIAADLIGFGLSGRKTVKPFFDLALWLKQARALLDEFDEDAVGIIGHSISGMLALRLAAGDRRVAKVMTTGTMGTRFPITRALRMVWTFPEDGAALRTTAKTLFHDKSLIDDAWIENRLSVLRTGNYGPYFSAMFEGEKQRYIEESVLGADELARIRCPVLLVHGLNDELVPFEQSSPILADAIKSADLLRLANCGHSPALEYPDKILAAVEMLFGR